jgi:hypothetical protein
MYSVLNVLKNSVIRSLLLYNRTAEMLTTTKTTTKTKKTKSIKTTTTKKTEMVLIITTFILLN